ncbi:hypothetical protein [Balneatrix alpica]|uniref:Uncharacterized protein n=1 Tax=Balneatrix alpica TaxID=75684 RepID=A0ABV5Z6C2_9GAMM|nr:hypothetical protein [Balneatrix alpica]
MPEQFINCPQCHGGIYGSLTNKKADDLIVCPHCRAVSFYAEACRSRIVALRRPRRARQPVSQQN